ncbi:OLC1v1012041C2 [Oldenlandia corymbosa var. corymbosa]|uniref:OLC1v1012041C2 n=1 Tax=Oldenlandia corymbosa var. corymbosa TaxID=529605 RepID=A0AAV1DV66_OLDCO|nr:OLC1v1012041C2 [Oldenlandia corymbosa var. corymbosa]
MQRLKSLNKLLSKTNLSRTSVFNFSSTNHHHHEFFSSQYTSWSSPSSRLGAQKISDGLCSNPVVRKVLWRRNTIVKNQSGQIRGLFYGTAKKGFGGAANFQHIRNYQSNYRFRSNYTSWFQRLTADGVVLGLIVTNVAVFLLWRVADRSFMMKNFTISLDNIRSGRIHTVLTSAFSHIDTGHIVSNMIGLYFFGTSLGRVFGPEFVLKLYLAGAVGGSVFYLVHHGFLALSSEKRQMRTFDSSRVPALGASGAVNAIMLLDIFLFPTKTLYFDLIIPVPAILLGIFLIGKDMLRILEGDSQISGSAHLGGATVAAAAWALVRKGRLRF